MALTPRWIVVGLVLTAIVAAIVIYAVTGSSSGGGGGPGHQPVAAAEPSAGVNPSSPRRHQKRVRSAVAFSPPNGATQDLTTHTGLLGAGTRDLLPTSSLTRNSALAGDRNAPNVRRCYGPGGTGSGVGRNASLTSLRTFSRPPSATGCNPPRSSRAQLDASLCANGLVLKSERKSGKTVRARESARARIFGIPVRERLERLRRLSRASLIAARNSDCRIEGLSPLDEVRARDEHCVLGRRARGQLRRAREEAGPGRTASTRSCFRRRRGKRRPGARVVLRLLDPAALSMPCCLRLPPDAAVADGGGLLERLTG